MDGHNKGFQAPGSGEQRRNWSRRDLPAHLHLQARCSVKSEMMLGMVAADLATLQASSHMCYQGHCSSHPGRLSP